MQEASAVLAAASNLFTTPALGSPFPETWSFRPAKASQTSEEQDGVHDDGQSCMFKMLQLWSKRHWAPSRPRYPDAPVVSRDEARRALAKSRTLANTRGGTSNASEKRKKGGNSSGGSQPTNRTRKRSSSKSSSEESGHDRWIFPWRRGTRKILAAVDERTTKGSSGGGTEAGRQGDEEDGRRGRTPAITRSVSGGWGSLDASLVQEKSFSSLRDPPGLSASPSLFHSLAHTTNVSFKAWCVVKQPVFMSHVSSCSSWIMRSKPDFTRSTGIGDGDA